MKQEIFVHWKLHAWDKEPSYAIHTADMSSLKEYHLLGTMDIDIPFDLPGHAEVIKGRVAGFREEQGRLTAKIANIEGQIQELLCIEHKPEVVE